MTFGPEFLSPALAELSLSAGSPTRFVVAFSGGMDSVVLSHALAAARDRHHTPIIAVHIDHALQDESHLWARECKSIASEIGIQFFSQRVEVEQDSGRGLEAAAREARYAALAKFVERGDWLMSAHHQDDQAETLLLNLARGSGPAGLAGIGRARPFSDGWLVRPMLQFPRSALQSYAEANELRWIDDPSNANQRFDRNFLRHEVLPQLALRWPDIAVRLARSANIAGDAARLLDDLAAMDLAALGGRPDRLALDGLRALSPARQRNVLRYAIRCLELPAPTSAHVQQLLDAVILAKDDAQPVLRWSGVQIRRYRNQLYVLTDDLAAPPTDAGRVIAAEGVKLADGLGVLHLEAGVSPGLANDVVARGLELRYRHGGEEFRPYGQSHTRKLKKLLQEDGVVPWMRDRIPLVYAGNELVAVADLWLASSAASDSGVAIRWSDRPALH